MRSKMINSSLSLVRWRVSVVWATVSILLVLHQAHAQDGVSSSYGKDFYIGFMRNVGGGSITTLRLLIGTDAVSADYVVETRDRQIQNGMVSSGNPVIVDVPSDPGDLELQVTGSDFDNREKGIHVYTTGADSIFVIGENFISTLNYGSFLAYPCLTIDTGYEYYIISTDDPTDFLQSQFLLVGCENDTTITVTPTQSVNLPQDPQTASAFVVVDPGITSHVFTLNQKQTLLVSSVDDLTGTKITSNKPLTVISGHECANIPESASGCEPLAVHVPPSATWGTKFLLAPFAGRSGTQMAKVFGVEGSLITLTCGLNTITYDHTQVDFTSREISFDGYCYLESSQPLLVVQLSSGGSIDSQGDPAIGMISPVDQYVNEITFFSLETSVFPSNYISVTVTIGHYIPQSILLDGTTIDCTWNAITDSGGEIIGYGCNKEVSSGVNTPAQHTVSHMEAGGLISVLAYGFSASPALGYAYLTGQNIPESMDDGSVSVLPFFNLMGFPGVMELDTTQVDVTSDPINIPNGLIFGDRLVTSAYVNENGVISFDDQWKFSRPHRFPTDYFPTRQGLAVAPFWSDNDIRREGAVRYASYCTDSNCTTHTEGEEFLAQVNEYIQSFQEEGEDQFQGTWLLAAHWDGVHPSPHGQDDHFGIPDDELNQVNNYQALVVSDVITTYVVFIYMCGEVRWSSVGRNSEAVVGFNAEGNEFVNHPLSGFSDIGDSISCTSQMGKRRKRQTGGSMPNNIRHRFPSGGNLQNQIKQCLDAEQFDKVLLTGTDPSDLAEMLEPCPCSRDQVLADYGRFRQQDGLPQCYLSTNPLEVQVLLGRITVTQQCCYDGSGALQTSRGGSAGTMLLHHPIFDTLNYNTRDKAFRDNCCNIGIDKYCDKYFDRRDINTCSGYSPPALGIGWGDPHYTTFDGRRYNFQGIGDFVLLEVLPAAGTMPVFTIQGALGRPTGWRGVTGHIGLAFGNQNFAFHFGMQMPGFRVFQTKPQPEREITAELVNGQPLEFPGEAMLIRNGPILRAAFYKSGVTFLGRVFGLANNEYYMNFEVRVPRSFSGRTRGLLGNLDGDSNNEYFRRDGTALSSSISERDLFDHLLTWQVQSAESLLIDPSPMFGRRKRQIQEDEPNFSDELELNATDEQRMICEENEPCIFDFVITEDVNIALATLNHEEDAKETLEVINNFPPIISAEVIFRVNVGEESVFSLNVVDPNLGDEFTLTVQGGLPADSVLEEIAEGEYAFRWNLMDVTTEPLVFIANDTRGASSTFIPTVEVCACVNGGSCILDVLLESDTTVVLNCHCSEAFAGEFCEEDRNGCSEIQCFDGLECIDVPAPGVGAVCGACPPGYTGDAQKCYDIDECSLDNTLCQQLCLNNDGGYTCACFNGFKLIEGTNQCEDVDECGGVNDCHQVCENTLGSFQCNCEEGFTLAVDGRTCTANVPCGGPGGCSFGCAVVVDQEECFCPIGFELSIPGGTQCVDRDECQVSPCDHLCTDTEGSFECSCMLGYELQADGLTCKDIDECLVAALGGMDACVNEMNSQCVNSEGSFDCVCAPGYAMISGSCERISCPGLEEVPNGMISYSTLPNAGSNFVSGTVATYDCNDNFALIGVATRLCEDSMEWSGSAPTCELIMCPDLPDPEHGDITFMMDTTAPFVVLTSANYHCDEGFLLSGGTDVRTCISADDGSSNGVWDGVPPTCEPISCPPLAVPDNVLNSAIVYTSSPNPNYAVGTVAIYFCSAGFAAVSGDMVRECIEDGDSMTGMWSGEEPTCASTANGCPDIPDPENGNIEFSGDTTAPFEVGTTATYSCDQGFNLDGGDIVRTCEENGLISWSGSAPSCVGTCPPLSAPVNGATEYSMSPELNNEFLSGTVVTYTCIEGFELFGNEMRTCQGNRSWTGNPPTCQVACPGLEDVAEGTVTYSSLPNSGNNFVAGTVATFDCNDSFRLAGMPTRLCEDSMEWSGSAPTCELITCPDIPDPENGDITFLADTTSLADTTAPFDLLTQAMYSCYEGFVLSGGNDVRTCIDTLSGDNSDGVWNGIAPNCDPISCPALAVPDNVEPIEYSSSPDPSYAFGTTAVYSCSPGFSIVSGDMSRTCFENGDSTTGMWSGEEPTCSPIVPLCPHIPNPEYGKIDFAEDTTAPFEVGTTAIYSCDPGFGLEGGYETILRTCEGDSLGGSIGEWSGAALSCVAVSFCPLLNVPNDVSVEYSTEMVPEFVFGTTATYSCSEGFGLNGGDAVRTCGPDGNDDTTGLWSGNAPSCDPIRCLDVPDPFDGQIEFEMDRTAPFDFGTEATYSCDGGFVLSAGNPVRTCGGDGSSNVGEWSGQALTCAREAQPFILPSLLQSQSGVTVQFAKLSYDINEGASELICVQVTGPLDKALFVAVSTVAEKAKGSSVDYVDISETLTFSKSPDELCLSLTTTPDNIYEKDERFKVRLNVADFQIFQTTTVIIKDDDPVGLSLLVDDSVCEGAGSVTVCVKLESAIEKDVVALVETSDGSFAKESEDYKKSQNTFFFSDLTHSQFVLCSSIDIVDDSVAEPREDFHVTLSSSSDRTFINGASSHTVLINDDDGVSEIYLTNNSPRITGTSLSAMFVVEGCANKVTCAVEDGTSADCTPELGSFNGHWYVPQISAPASSQTLHLTVEPCCGQPTPVSVNRQFRTDNPQCSLHFTDRQYSVDSDNGNVIVEWEGTGPSEQTQVSAFFCKIDGGISFACSSPHVIQGLGQHTINVTPVSIEGCLNVIGRSLLINVPNN